MSTADHIAWTGHVGPFLKIEVDDTGNIRAAVDMHQGANVYPDGWARSDIPNADTITEATDRARLFVAAVFPPGKSEYTWQQRAEAYSALNVAGKIGLLKDKLAREVDLFLNEYAQAEKAATEGDKRPHMTMEAYAVGEYERWW